MHRFRLVPAVYLLLVRGQGPGLEVLLQRRGPGTSFRPGHWAAAAAGHVEQGESVYAAAGREAREELGIVVHAHDMAPLCAMQRTLPGVSDPVEQRVDFFLVARAWTGEPAVQEPEKAETLGWFRPAALPSPMVPHEEYLLGLLADETVTGSPVPAVLTYGF
jgi:8-oxo-dGTP pyrophosphatase MutT (NUDIX family)